MSKNKIERFSETECEVVKTIKDKYYSIIVLPNNIVNNLFKKAEYKSNLVFKLMLHTTLWRCTGTSTAGTSDFINYLNTRNLKTDEDSFVGYINNLHSSITDSIIKLMSTMEPAQQVKFYNKNKIFLINFVDKNGVPIIDNEIQFQRLSFGNIFGEPSENMVSPLFLNRKKNSVIAYELASRILHIAFEKTVLGVGDAPMYVPSVVKGISNTVMLMALYKDHPLYEIFKNASSNLLINNDAFKDNEIVEINQLTLDVFNKMKNPPPESKT